MTNRAGQGAVAAVAVAGLAAGGLAGWAPAVAAAADLEEVVVTARKRE